MDAYSILLQSQVPCSYCDARSDYCTAPGTAIMLETRSPCLQNRTEDEAYLGNLGPIVRAAVGDRILFHFLNRLKMPVSVHPHGVFYNKSSEGALYSDGTSGILSIPLPYALRIGKPCWLRACI